MIENYRFGHIVINGNEYTSDVKIFSDHVMANWWRSSGHLLSISDIEDILRDPPEVLIIGTGSSGVMKVPEEVQKEVRKLGIELIVERTSDACNTYNELENSKQKQVVAALHLTC